MYIVAGVRASLAIRGACLVPSQQAVTWVQPCEVTGDSSATFLTSYWFRRAQPSMLEARHLSELPASALQWRIGTPCPCCMQEANFVPQQLRQQSMWTLLRTACVVISSEAFSAAVVYCDADQALCHRTRRFTAATLVCTVPEADVEHLVPPERRFDLSAFSFCTWPRSSPSVVTTATPVPSEASSPSCAWTPTAETSDIPYCKKGLADASYCPRMTRRSNQSACVCTRLLCVRPASQWHQCRLWLLSAWRWSSVCGARRGFELQICLQSLRCLCTW